MHAGAPACSRGMMIQKILFVDNLIMTFQLDAYIDEELGLEHLIKCWQDKFLVIKFSSKRTYSFHYLTMPCI